MKKKVYIASPYTLGDPVLNVRRSLYAADELMNNGFVPFVPLLCHFWHFYSPKIYTDWVEYDLEWIFSCNILLRLPGESEGADKEVREATIQGIPVYYSVEDLVKEEDCS